MLNHTVELDVFLHCPGKAEQQPGVIVIDPREIKRLEEVCGDAFIVMNDGERFKANCKLWAIERRIEGGFKKIADYETERDIERMNRELDGKN